MQLIRRGDRGPAVAEVRSMLHALGLLADVAGDAYGEAEFDAATERAVRAFQQGRGLAADGIVGAETYRTLEEARWSLGDRTLYRQVGHPFVGDDVVALQAWLLDRGFDAGRRDGIFGARTEAALVEFQRNVGLKPDGIFGPQTQRAIDRLRRAVGGGRADHMREHEALFRSGPALAGKTVIVDPGHGGADRGWTSGALVEADLAYDIAARLEGRLAAAGAIPFLTRSADGDVSVADRAEFANSAEADLYLSIHVDGSPSARCQGVATYYFGNARSGASAVGERLADLVQREVVARTDLLDCRTHPQSWELLRLTRMPAVQVDAGYLTNAHDAARLGEPEFRDTIAEALLAGVQRLYLPAAQDPGTGQLRLADLTRA
ncbi:MAG TPA: N-acetylmuramoyl-L-alanine amidase [Mycobacteriales bacterium]|nr:N-acetylmuramoyl-L-alanine amidase [Mycobacteriales bacterium]